MAQTQDETSRKPRLSASEKLKQRNRELGILKAIAEELNRAVDVKSALEYSLKMVAELLGLRAGWVWLLDETSSEPYLAASLMLPPYLTAKPKRMQGKNCTCLLAFLRGELSGALNLECSRLEGAANGTNGLRYHASIPIYAHDKPMGVINVASSDWRRLEPDDLELLRIIAYQIGVAVERARLFDQTVQLAAAEERNRLAREIHDTIAQGMAAAIFNLESAEVLLDDPAPERQRKGRAKLQKALAVTRANLEESRRWVLDLRAAPFLERPLAEALAGLVEIFGAEVEIEAHFCPDVKLLDRRYSSRLEMALYRIAQESLANVRKHAQAKSVVMTLAAEHQDGKEWLRLEIQDNGLGFDPARLEESSPAEDTKLRRWGLIGMNERVRFLGGQLKIESYPGSGTRIEAFVPLG